MNKKQELQLQKEAEHYFQMGNYVAAEVLFESILENNPKNSKANELLAYILGNNGEFESAFIFLERATNEKNCSPEALYYFGSMQLKKGNFSKAITLLKKSIALGGEFFEGLHDLATAFAQSGLYKEAVFAYQKAVKYNSQSPDLFYNMARLYDELKKFEEAIECYTRAIHLKPNYVAAWYNRGLSFYELKRYNEALDSYNEALKLDENYIEAWANKGVVLHRLKKYDEAMLCHNKAIEVNPNEVNVYVNKAGTLGELKCYDEAIICYQKARDIQPDCAQANCFEAMLELLLGKFESGWKKYESRWGTEDFEIYRYSNIPRLNTVSELSNKKILIWAEQGYGDTIQFVRYVILLINLGAQVIIEVQASLKIWMQFALPCRVIARGDKLEQVDFQCPLLSLPFVLGMHEERDIPDRVPYLKISNDKVNQWYKKLNISKEKLNIGIACSGRIEHVNDIYRSMPLSLFAPLIPLANLFLLQKKVRSVDQEFLQENKEIIFLGDQLTDFEDTAAVVENMDLIISVDTSLVHVAGALGKKVYVLLPWASEWRWLLDRVDSPWYPSVRLFRQPAIEDWPSVIREVIQVVSTFDKR